MDYINCESINLKFGDKIIYDNFNFSAKRGEKIVISGKSGVGKSTLFKLLMGFQRPDSGGVYIDGQPLKKANIFEIRRQFAYVNQDVTFRDGVAKSVLSDIAKFSGNNFNGELNKKLLTLFEFDAALLNKNVTKLSGGERQRFGLMIALSLNRPVLLLDEVTSALDNALKHNVLEFVTQTDKTVISISHDSVWQESKTFRKLVW